MKYLIFFTLVLMGVLTTEACNPDGHANHKADDNHKIEYEDVTTTIKPSMAVQHVEATMKPSSDEGVHSTEKAIIVLAETTNNKTTPVVAEMVTSTLTIVTSMKPAIVSLNTTQIPAETIHKEVNKTSITIPVEMTTVAAHVISTENPGNVTSDMMATTTATTHVETSTHHVTEGMNINKTTMMTMSSMPMIVTSATVVRERRQVNGTMKPSTPTNIPVFGSRFSTKVPMPLSRNAGQGTTVGPATAGSRTTMKSKVVTKHQPARLSPTSRVRTPVTMKPQPVTTGSVPVRG